MTSSDQDIELYDICVQPFSEPNDGPPLSNNYVAPDCGSGPLRIAVDPGKLWPNGSELRIRLLPGGDEKLRVDIERFAKIWTKYANISMTFVNEGDAHIRVAINKESGSYSRVGTDALKITDQTKHTMHLDFRYNPEGRVERTTCHEFGHALGCLHEHQGPSADIKWDKPYVFAEYEKRGWNKEMVKKNLFARYDGLQPFFDKESIMLYPIDKKFTTDGFSVGWNNTLSTGDKTLIREMYPQMGHSVGEYYTPGGEQYPPLAQDPPATSNHKQILFAHEYPTPPNIAVGISGLDISTQRNVRVNAVAGRITGASFVIHVDTWNDSILYSGGANWLETDEKDRDFRVGSFNTMEVRPWDKPEKQAKKRIDFDRPFEHTPTIVIWINFIDADNSRRIRIKAYPTDIDKKGFTIHIDTSGDSILYSGGASWIAYRSGRPGTHSGTGDTQSYREADEPQLLNGGSCNFPDGIFGGSPKVLMAINRIDFDNESYVRFKAFPNEISNEGMRWNVNCWDDTVCYGAGVSYLALE